MTPAHTAELWLDPGDMTGFALLTSHGDFWADEFPFYVACDWVAWFCRTYGPGLKIGWERFTITAETHKLTRQPDAIHIIGVCRWQARLWHCQVLAEAQRHTPNAAEQAELRELNWWVPGKNDAQSAACHLLKHLQRSNTIPSVAAGKLAALRSRSGE